MVLNDNCELLSTPPHLNSNNNMTPNAYIIPGLPCIRRSREDIINEYFNSTEYPLSVIKQKTRKKNVVLRRYIYMYALMQYCGYTNATTGLKSGGFDHSTVVHAVRKINEWLEFDKVYKPIIENHLANIKERLEW